MMRVRVLGGKTPRDPLYVSLLVKISVLITEARMAWATHSSRYRRFDALRLRAHAMNTSTPVIQVYHIPVSKDKLREMPSDERSLMLLLGYSANQISMLQKLLMFSSNKQPPTETEQLLSAAQTQMLLRLIIGALHETWLLIKDRYLSSHIGRDYQTRLDDSGRVALDNLKHTFGRSNVISMIRNNFSYHHPETATVDVAFNQACSDPNSDELWSLYFSQYGFNSQFLVSDLMVMHGISYMIGEPNPIAAQPKIMKETVESVANIFEFTKAFFAAAWLKNFGATLDAKEAIAVSNPPAIGNVSIPFFVNMDPSSIGNL
jgi:hypothetical protein